MSSKMSLGFLSGHGLPATSRVTIGRALFLGFGAVFVLWVVSTYELMRRLSNVQRQAFDINILFAESEELLFTPAQRHRGHEADHTTEP
jgi:hypothetical protein